MSTSYADSAQAREWDRRYDAYGRPRQVSADFFHDYEASAARSAEREAIRLAERKAAQVRINAAVEQIGDFFGLNDNVSNGPLHGTCDVQGVNMNATTELATVPPKETALAVYSAANGLDPWLEQIRGEVDKFLSVLPDLTTKKGRDLYASMAHKIAKSKTALDAVGKELSAQQKEVPKRIDAERKRVWDKLETWQKEVRKPLDDWQAAEDRRIDAIKADIELISDHAMHTDGVTAADLEGRISRVEAVTIEGKWAEFQLDAAKAKDSTLATLRNALTARKQYEADQAELAQRRADDEARAQREHDERIRKEAAEQAQRDADEAAQRERDQAEQREKALKQQAEESEQKAKQAKADQEAAEQRAEREREESAARQEQAVEQARIAEKKRADDAAAEIVRQQDARAADTAHRAKINRSALEAFTANGLTEACAKQAITLIVQGKIPAIALTY
jgi:phage-related minor tail protein